MSKIRAAAALVVGGLVAGCTYTEEVAVGYPAAQAAGIYGPRAFPPGLVWDVAWAEMPKAGALRGVYPARAQDLRLGGTAAAECEVGPDGRLSKCATIDESPEGFGFGAATLAISSRLRAQMRTASGVNLVGRRVRYRIDYEAGPRFSRIGFCERVKLELGGRPTDQESRTAQVSNIMRLGPHFAATAAEAQRRLDAAGPAARAVVSEQLGSARRIADECDPETRPESDFRRAAPEAFMLWVDPAGEPHVVERANWAARPVAEDVLRVYPPEALARRASGRAQVQCRVTGAGALTNCIVVRESPAGLGFGPAVVRLAHSKMRMVPERIDGAAASDGIVTVPVVFAVE